jgi:hypothetical protein
MGSKYNGRPCPHKISLDNLADVLSCHNIPVKIYMVSFAIEIAYCYLLNELVTFRALLR